MGETSEQDGLEGGGNEKVVRTSQRNANAHLALIWEDSPSISGLDDPQPRGERAGQSEISYADGGGSEQADDETVDYKRQPRPNLYDSQSTCGLDVQELMGEKVELRSVLNYCES